MNQKLINPQHSPIASMTISAIVAKVLDNSAMHASSAYSRVLAAGPILKARSMREPDVDWATTVVLVIAFILLAAKIWLAWVSRVRTVRQSRGSADEEMAVGVESYGTINVMEEDDAILEVKVDVAGADFA